MMHLFIKNIYEFYSVPFGFFSVAGDEVIVHVKQADPQQVENNI